MMVCSSQLQFSGKSPSDFKDAVRLFAFDCDDISSELARTNRLVRQRSASIIAARVRTASSSSSLTIVKILAESRDLSRAEFILLCIVTSSSVLCS